MDHNKFNKADNRIKFVCSKCFFLTDKESEITEHIKICKEQKIIKEEEYIKVITELSNYRKQVLDYERKEIESNNKISLLLGLLKDNTNINVETILNNWNYNVESIVPSSMVQPTKESSVQPTKEPSVQLTKEPSVQPTKEPSVQPIKESLVQPTVKPLVQETVEPLVESNNQENKLSEHDNSEKESRKTIFRSVKSMETKDEYTEEEFNKIVMDVINKETSDPCLAELYNITEKECRERIKKILELIKTSRQYAGELKQMAYTRLKLFKFLDLSEYKLYLKEHINIIKDILETRMDKKKISGIIKNKVLLPLELRILDYNGYETIILDTSEISLFRKYLRYRYGFEREYHVFQKNEIRLLYETYNVALFNVIDYAKIIIPNKFKINNLVYVKVPKYCEEDPFSFYYLNNKKENTRNWKMDCRLEDLTQEITSEILEYCITLYRKIYYKVYHDNDYRENHVEQIFEYEGEQLIQNIMLLSNFYEFNKKMRDLIVEKCYYVPTKNDKFNLYCDDAINKKRFINFKKDDVSEIVKKNISRLFDNINQEQIETFYMEKQNS